MDDLLVTEHFFDLKDFCHAELFAGGGYAWEALDRLPSYIAEKIRPNVIGLEGYGEPLPETVVIRDGRLLRKGFVIRGGDVTKGRFEVEIDGEVTNQATVLFAGSVLWDRQIELGPGVVVEPGALIKGPTIVEAQTEVRQGAYIRGKCLIGERCVVGHTTEIKASVMLDEAKAGHFAYIGDSLLGNRVNLGAGTKLANLKITGSPVLVRMGEKVYDTGRRKLGAIMGDDTELGCNCVTNPGVLLGKKCQVVPLMSVRAGYYVGGVRLQ